MVKEVEDFFSDQFKDENKVLFPKYFVVREQEDWNKLNIDFGSLLMKF